MSPLDLVLVLVIALLVRSLRARPWPRTPIERVVVHELVGPRPPRWHWRRRRRWAALARACLRDWRAA